ncbi:hypothetical protein PM082_000053 [Marasmius tenuissimus]|nr:hypothetical protein PM082_000053 [Marasmius tenuissimus]
MVSSQARSASKLRTAIRIVLMSIEVDWSTPWQDFTEPEKKVVLDITRGRLRQLSIRNSENLEFLIVGESARIQEAFRLCSTVSGMWPQYV